jgi:hypothetical protein
MSTSLEDLQRSLDELKGIVGGLASTPTARPVATAGVEDAAVPAPSRGLMSVADRFEMRRLLREKSLGELHAMFAMQAMKSDQGIPLAAWLQMGGAPRAAAFDNLQTAGLDPEIQKLLDTSGGTALVRQDLEPLLFEMYIRAFPAWEQFPKEPANGLVHTFQQITSFGGAEFIGELGTVPDDKNTYLRQTTNIAIVATRRGVTLKQQFAALQSGSGFNPENLELQGGLRAIAKKMQDQIFSGHSTDSGGTADNELGLYDANGFTGLRSILNTARAVNVDPATNPDTTGSLRRAMADAVTTALQEGGAGPNSVWAHPFDYDMFAEQQEDKQRWVNTSGPVTAGVYVDAVMTAQGRLGIAIVPGNSIDDYVYQGASSNGVDPGDTVRDIYLLDTSTVSLPYLGSEGPTVLDIPIGVAGQLTHLYIVFGMWGLAVKAVPFNNKVRVKVA